MEADSNSTPNFIYTKQFKILLIVILVVVTISLIIYYSVKKGNDSRFYNSGFLLKNVETSKVSIYPECEIPQPLDYVNYTITFTIYIENFYHNYGSWRHVFHKGSALDDTHVNYRYIDEINDGWSDLSSDISKQNPGLWLHPNKNSLRFAIETEYNYEYCPDTQANPYSSIKKNLGKMPIEHENRFRLQYFDLEDIPVKTHFNITFSINKNTVNVYYNGVLKNIFTLKGMPIFNKGPLYIHHPNTYTGKLDKFQYFPKLLSDKNIFTLSK